MTSASELFYNRRSRVGRSTEELGIGYALDRNLPQHHNRRRHHHHHHHNRNPVVDDCDPLRRSPHVRHLCQSEHELVQIGHNTSQSGTSNITSTETSSHRTARLRSTRNDRLPGAVLLARQRLLERLRGVSLSGHRHSGRASSGISWDELAFSSGFRLVNAGDWETETPREWLSRRTPYSDSTAQTDLPSLQDLSQKKPPGLSKEEVKYLHREVFHDTGLSSEGVMLEAAPECSICLERFQEGDWLVCLPCEHRFHTACINPWVQTCGDCPYCRTSIVIGDHRAVKNIPSSSPQ